jgi:hypothetical protein
VQSLYKVVTKFFSGILEAANFISFEGISHTFGLEKMWLE